MKKTHLMKSVENELQKIPSAAIVTDNLKKLFLQLKKGLEIEKDITYTDALYLQPFKIEYVGVSAGMKNYYVDIENQLENNRSKYCKLCIKNEGKLVSIKSFGKVENLHQATLNKLLLLIRLSQYIKKHRELYSLEISLLQLLK